MKKYLVLLTAVLFFITNCGINIKKYEHLKEPRIINMEKQKIIYVEVPGNPDEMTGAVGELYKAYFKSKFKNKKMVPPKARWPKPFETPINEWVGIWALPVPEEINNVPEIKNSRYQIKIGCWDYGKVAEILHIGPYEKEIPAIEKLKKFIESNNYEVIPDTHEEEYIRGPGMFGKGDPEKYITIIRYTLKKK